MKNMTDKLVSILEKGEIAYAVINASVKFPKKMRYSKQKEIFRDFESFVYCQGDSFDKFCETEMITSNKDEALKNCGFKIKEGKFAYILEYKMLQSIDRDDFDISDIHFKEQAKEEDLANNLDGGEGCEIPNIKDMRKDIAYNLGCLEFAIEDWNNKKEGLQIVKDYSETFGFLSEELKNTPEIALEAVKNDETLFEYLPEKMKNTPEILLVALEQDESFIEEVEDNLKKIYREKGREGLEELVKKKKNRKIAKKLKIREKNNER